MNRVDVAVSRFREGFNCSQAVLSAFAPDLGLDCDIALRIASGFGGGMARMGRTCGAVTGALMAIGLRYGPSNTSDQEARRRIYPLVREFVERFEARNGSSLCRELLGYHIGTPEGLQAVREKGLFSSLCPNLVRDAAQILEELLEGMPCSTGS